MMETRRNGRKEKAVANGIGSQTKKKTRLEINLNPLIKEEEGTSVIKKERKAKIKERFNVITVRNGGIMPLNVGMEKENITRILKKRQT